MEAKLKGLKRPELVTLLVLLVSVGLTYLIKKYGPKQPLLEESVKCKYLNE